MEIDYNPSLNYPYRSDKYATMTFNNNFVTTLYLKLWQGCYNVVTMLLQPCHKTCYILYLKDCHKVAITSS